VRVLYDPVLRAPVAIALSFALACSSKPDAPRAEPPPEGSHREASSADDRAVAEAGEPGTSPRPDRPAAGAAPARPTQGRPTRPIDIVLRSSPPGATAAVDGVPIGPTPAYWSGDANGREREFTFVLPGYAFARYRFVPITSGVVHARLEILAADTPAGVPPEMMRAPDAPAPELRPRAPAASPSPSQPAAPSAPPPMVPSAPDTAPRPPNPAPASPNSAPTTPSPEAVAPVAPSAAPVSPEATPAPVDAAPAAAP
jgi:hypothetical protein